MSRGVIQGMLVGAIVLDVAFWSVWFTKREWLASEHSRAYYEFENAFPLADAWQLVTYGFGHISKEFVCLPCLKYSAIHVGKKQSLSLISLLQLLLRKVLNLLCERLVESYF